MTQVFETDWLASRPVFYNERTGKVSHNINNVIDFANVEFDPEGFNNYLDFGYSVFEQTPVKHVKFLRHSSRLTVHDDGRLEVEYLDDPVEQWIGKTSHEDDVLHRLETSIRRWEKSVEGEIIIPTSGGYDSRLLNFFIEDKFRIRSFTYGISENQAESYEVVYARRLSEILGARWEQIELGEFHYYFDDWYELFGASTHAHGMYHIEFYTQILSRVAGRNPFLAGIIGDAWAGGVRILAIDGVSDLAGLGYTHGLQADPAQSVLACNYSRRHEYLEKMKEKLSDPLYRVVEAMRFKIILLSYLTRVPSYFGFRPRSPFLDESIALSMATLPADRRQDRLWQKQFFQRNGIDLENMSLKVSHANTLNLDALKRVPVTPLNGSLLREVIRPEYVDRMNRSLQRYVAPMNRVSRIRKVGGALRRLGFSAITDRQAIEAYNAYLVLWPIEKLLKRRNGDA